MKKRTTETMMVRTMLCTTNPHKLMATTENVGYAWRTVTMPTDAAKENVFAVEKKDIMRKNAMLN